MNGICMISLLYLLRLVGRDEGVETSFAVVVMTLDLVFPAGLFDHHDLFHAELVVSWPTFGCSSGDENDQKNLEKEKLNQSRLVSEKSKRWKREFLRGSFWRESGKKCFVVRVAICDDNRFEKSIGEDLKGDPF